MTVPFEGILMKKFLLLLTATFYSVFSVNVFSRTTEIKYEEIKNITDKTVAQAMKKDQIPGVAVAIVLNGQTYLFNYGLSDIEQKKPVTDSTIFEIGSISKTFTATLATYAEVEGKLNLTDMVENYIPELKGTPFGKVKLLNLGTHTTGGLPLQIPDEIQNMTQLIKYFHDWKPEKPTGTIRTYANSSIGTLGWITGQSLNIDFNSVMDQILFKPLGLTNTYFSIPNEKLTNYAWGYTKDNKPIHVNPGLLDNESYGIKTTATDLAIFLKANMNEISLSGSLKTALNSTHKGYFKVGKMTQDLIWEEYQMPVDLKTLKEGNSNSIILNPTPVIENNSVEINDNVWINKTGSTNGFGAYIAFVPEKKFGIVILANKNYPNSERIEIAYKIYHTLFN